MKRIAAIIGMHKGSIILLAPFMVFSFCYLLLCGCSEGSAAERSARPDLVTIDSMMRFGELERTPVLFPHDLHTKALKDSSCTACHYVREDGYLSFKFKRLSDVGKQEVMELYHGDCIACHQKNDSEGKAAGPVACGDCHRRRPIYVSSRRPFGFDKSLHYRHIKANGEKCENCHHVYDEETKKLVYKKGKENSCRDCHRKLTEENRSSFKLAAHEACIGCHLKRAKEEPSKPVGPNSCEGCHDLAHQLTIKTIEIPPRLKRNQPDFLLLSAPETELESTKLNTVPFSHINHERYTMTCRACHHETLLRCKECHPLHGSDKGKGITLQQAMHDMKSGFACAGCHQEEKSKPACAGCHDRMEQERLSNHACNICHSGPSPKKMKRLLALHEPLEAFKPKPSEVKLGFSSGDIPDSVTIDVLSKEFQPAVMPHRKIIDKLIKYIKDSKIATYFHGRDDVVCQGCHHYGTVGIRPALCENCHGKPFNEHELFKPGLQGAYHRQCLGCHRSMHVKQGSDCTLCHAKRLKSAEVGASNPTRRGGN
jgi:hypothetical protein